MGGLASVYSYSRRVASWESAAGRELMRLRGLAARERREESTDYMCRRIININVVVKGRSEVWIKGFHHGEHGEVQGLLQVGVAAWLR